jgi:hypothetical protein
MMGKTQASINPWPYLGINPQQTQEASMDRLRRMLFLEPTPLQSLLQKPSDGAAMQGHPYDDLDTKHKQEMRENSVPARRYSQENT